VVVSFSLPVMPLLGLVVAADAEQNALSYACTAECIAAYV